MNKCDEQKGKTLFDRMPSNDREDMTKFENLYFAIIVVIIDSAKNHQ